MNNNFHSYTFIILYFCSNRNQNDSRCMFQQTPFKSLRVVGKYKTGFIRRQTTPTKKDGKLYTANSHSDAGKLNTMQHGERLE